MFVFDKNRCVGCMACVVACKNKNTTLPGVLYRQVNTFNSLHYPHSEVFYISLACNHCQNAPCMDNCPAKAYSKNAGTKAIVHSIEKCIGCKYCTWVCPFDAPKYNLQNGTVEKCNYCYLDTQSGVFPACTTHCPTGALSFSFHGKAKGDFSEIKGFPLNQTHPDIEIIPLVNKKPEIVTTSKHNTEISELEKNIPKQEKKINPAKEWSLVVFTFLVSAMSGLFAAKFQKTFTYFPEIYTFVMIFLAIISSLHLGKKQRAYRAIFNFRKSWLSREIFFFGLFTLLSTIQLFLFPYSNVLYIVSCVSAILMLLSIDRIYYPLLSRNYLPLHSAETVFTALLFTAIGAHNYNLLLQIVIIKSILYISRKLWFYANNVRTNLWITALRLDFLLSVPFILWLCDFPHVFVLIASSIIISEITDRIEYYHELNINTPAQQMQQDLLNDIKK